MIDLWVRYFQDPRNKISAVFSGHDHIYARMSDGSTTPFVVSGGADADLYSAQGSSVAQRVTSAAALNFVSVRLSGPLLQATAYDDKGQVLDRFSVNRAALPAATGVDSLTTDPGGAAQRGLLPRRSKRTAAAPLPAGGCALAWRCPASPAKASRGHGLAAPARTSPRGRTATRRDGTAVGRTCRRNRRMNSTGVRGQSLPCLLVKRTHCSETLRMR